MVKEITGAPKVNVAALCVGGTLATMLAAYLEAIGDRSLNSLTLMNTLVDFSEPGPLGAYTDRPTIERLLRRVEPQGAARVAGDGPHASTCSGPTTCTSTTSARRG